MTASTPIGITLILALLFIGCTPKPYTEPGIQAIEKKMIIGSYYWEKGKDPDTFTDAEINKLFDRALSTEPYDGERSEIYSSQLAWALTSAGDEHFARLLSERSEPTKAKVLSFIDGLWEYHKLSYPRTQALLTKKKHNKSEQATPRKPPD